MRNGEKFNSFISASSKAEKACVTSEVSDADEVLASKRVPKKKVFSSDEETESEEFSDPPPPPKVDKENYLPKGYSYLFFVFFVSRFVLKRA